jgi:hypothetical protein
MPKDAGDRRTLGKTARGALAYHDSTSSERALAASGLANARRK